MTHQGTLKAKTEWRKVRSPLFVFKDWGFGIP
jgi:hypothetical protein